MDIVWPQQYQDELWKLLHKKWSFLLRKLRIWSHLLKKSLIENFIFCAVGAKSIWYCNWNIHSSFNKDSFKREDKSYECSFWGNSEVWIFGLRNQHSKNFTIKKLRQRILTFRYFFGATLDKSLTLSWRRPLSYRSKSIDLLCKSMDWFLYDNGHRHERVKQY